MILFALLYNKSIFGHNTSTIPTPLFVGYVDMYLESYMVKAMFIFYG